MNWKTFKIQQLLVVFCILWHILSTSGSYFDAMNQRGSSNTKNGLQDENFHEPNRWKPPLRLIPFNPSKMARIPLQPPEDSSESGIGSGSNSQVPCDDEDNDCGGADDKNGQTSGDGIEVEVITKWRENETLATTVSTAKSNPRLNDSNNHSLKLRTEPIMHTTKTHGVNSKIILPGTLGGMNMTTSKPSTERARMFTSITSAQIKTTTGIIPTKGGLKATSEAVKSNMTSHSQWEETTKMEMKYKNVTTTPTTPITTGKSYKRVALTVATTPKDLSSKTAPNTQNISNNSNNKSVPQQVSTTQFTWHVANKTHFQYHTSEAASSDRKVAKSVNSSSVLIENYKNQTRPRSVAKIAKSTVTPTKTDEKNRQIVVSTTASYLNSSIDLSNLNRTHNQPNQPNQTVLDLNMKGDSYENITMPVTQTQKTEHFSQQEVTTASPHKSSMAYVHENRVEDVFGNACHDVICRSGGACQEHGDNRGKCMCPIGTGGKYCENAQHFIHPRFHGSSYLVFNHKHNIGNNFRVSMEFKSDAENGILFFGGDPDNISANFFAVILVNQYVQIRTECGSGFIAITSHGKLPLSSWHHVTARRFDDNVYLQVNGDPLISGSSGCLKKDLRLHQLNIGGLKSNALQMRNIGLIPGFSGCMRKLTINNKDYNLRSKNNTDMHGVDIGDCSDGSCDLQKCINAGTCMPFTKNSSKCSCPLGFTGENCSEDFDLRIPQFNVSSYIQFDGLGSSAWAKIDIEMIVKPQSENGLLFYNGDKRNGRGDYILIALKNGYVELRFDCGTGGAVIRSRRKTTHNKWHHIKVRRRGNIGELLLDMDDSVFGKSKGAFKMLKLREPLFIGGAKSFADIPLSADIHSYFKGCIEKVYINKKQLNWTNAVDGKDVSNCNSHDCMKNNCSNHGLCESYKGESWCHCYLGYSGRNCGKGMNISVPKFNGHSFLKFEDRELFKHINRPASVFSLEFKTTSPNGLILWNGQKLTNMPWKGDFISLAVIDGFLVCRYNLGGGDAVLNSSRKFNDGKWHKIYIHRNNGHGKMQIDDSTVAVVQSVAKYVMLNTNGELFLGGAENIVSTTGSRHLHGFNGCIKNIEFGNRNIDLIVNASKGHHLDQCT